MRCSASDRTVTLTISLLLATAGGSLLGSTGCAGILSGGNSAEVAADGGAGGDLSTIFTPLGDASWADGAGAGADLFPGGADGALADAANTPDAKITVKPDAKITAKPDAATVKPDQGPPPPPPPTSGKTYYVRPGGGTAAQCTGLVNANYPGSGTKQACAFSHPFIALSPTAAPLLKGGDTLLIGTGSYRMGLGAPGGGGCSSAYPWDCVMPPIPSGPSAAAPTRILGEGYASGCKAAPQLFGVERAWRVLDLAGSSNVRLECLEITDHSGCVDGHSGGLACQRNSYPYGDWAAVGLRARDSSNVVLRHLDIHGLASTGIHAGRLKDWTLEDVSIVGHGMVGFDGDLADGKGSSNSGQLTFRRVTIAYNGCAETYPGRQPAGCWAQSAGGYGDGLGTAATGGDWLFEDCKVLHNTSDGIDLLYHTLGGTITVRRLRAEGNAGNQLKTAGSALIENSVLIGNCAYFQGQPFTHNVDNCRALGNTLSLSYTGGEAVTLVNSTLYGQGDVLVLTGPRDSSTSCSGTEQLTAINNIFVGDTEYLAPFEKTGLHYNDGCTGLTFTEDYNMIHNVKGSCPGKGAHDLCQDPLLTKMSGGTFQVLPLAGSPAVDSGKPVGGGVPAVDFFSYKRPVGAGVDRGACELGAK